MTNHICFWFSLKAVGQSMAKKYRSVAIPICIAYDIDELIEECGYWLSRVTFVREACLEKIRMERKLLKECTGSKVPKTRKEMNGW